MAFFPLYHLLRALPSTFLALQSKTHLALVDGGGDQCGVSSEELGATREHHEQPEGQPEQTRDDLLQARVAGGGHSAARATHGRRQERTEANEQTLRKVAQGQRRESG